MPGPKHDDITSHPDDELVAIPRLAEEVGVTPRVMRYWEEQDLISPTRDHGKLRYSPHDLGIARLVRLLLDTGLGIDGVRAVRTSAEREIRGAEDEAHLAELAIRILYARKAFREVTGMEPEHFPRGKPEHFHHGPGKKAHTRKPPPHDGGRPAER